MGLRRPNFKRIIFGSHKLLMLSIIALFFYFSTKISYLFALAENDIVNKENKYHQYCDKEAHSERGNELWGVINSGAESNKNIHQITGNIDKYYTACIERRTLQQLECYKKFNQTYYDRGFNPELYGNVRTDTLKLCSAKAEAKFVCNRLVSLDIISWKKRNILEKDFIKTAERNFEHCLKMSFEENPDVKKDYIELLLRENNGADLEGNPDKPEYKKLLLETE